MDSINTVESDKPVSFEKRGSIKDAENHQAEFGTLKEHASDLIKDHNSIKDHAGDLIAESHSNGLPDFNNTAKEPPAVLNDFVEPSKPIFGDRNESPVPEFHDDIETKNFCGTQVVHDNPTDLLVNDDIEEFVSSQIKPTETYSSSLLDFEPPNESVKRSEFDEFEAHPGNKSTPVYLEDDIIEPVSSFKESIPIENLISIDTKEDDFKFKELDDSPRGGTPDFLDLEQDDVKSIGVQKAPEKLPEPVPEKLSERVPDKLPEAASKKPEYAEKPEIGPKEIFSKYGLDIWFNPERLNPTVEAFIYWRDPKLSAIVFVSGLVLLLSMAYYSLISVIANTGLTILVCAMGFRVYKHVLQAVQKTDQAHPYSVFLDGDIKLPEEKVHELLDTLLIHINAYLGELKRFFLVENWIESIKFAVVLWILTYLGSWFNGLTLVIIGFVSLFTLPKVYENNKVQIDQNLALVHVKLEELTNKIKDVLPALLRKKLPAKKE